MNSPGEEDTIELSPKGHGEKEIIELLNPTNGAEEDLPERLAGQNTEDTCGEDPGPVELNPNKLEFSREDEVDICMVRFGNILFFFNFNPK